MTARQVRRARMAKVHTPRRNAEPITFMAATLVADDVLVFNRLRGGIVALNEIVQLVTVLGNESYHVDWDGLSFLTASLAHDCFSEDTIDRAIAIAVAHGENQQGGAKL